ncbi:phage scaffolding protein [Leuconostoc lactis]|uniref:phage scaffolding protein n=1 Tax=Leuconostoc lactis TaxID=1246 RepID=UPI0024ADBC8C|nr:phage scaffolding protein [Leuconostoc lactis]MDI6572759.1 phage scaffolding protein [Leuconostoc lactis]
MKTEDLTAIGLTKEQVDSVFKLHGQEVNDLNAQVSTLTAERDGYQSQVDDVTTKLNDAKAATGNNQELTSQLQQLQSDLDSAKQEAENRVSQTKVDYELKLALKENGALNDKAVSALLDRDVIKLDNEGKITGLSEQIEAVKTENPFLFETQADPIKPKIVSGGNPNPNPGGSGKAMADYTYKELSDLKSNKPTEYQALLGGN